MKTTLIFKKHLLLTLCMCLAISTQAQIRAGKITFERKINLAKKYKDNMQFVNNIKEEDRIKSELFELSFNDSLSYYGPKPTDERDRMSYTTTHNELYKNLLSNKFLTIKDVFGEKVYI